MKKCLFLPVLLIAFFGQNCTKEVSPSTDIPAISFNQVVFPIIVSNCTASGCHGEEDTEKFVLLDYEAVIEHCEVKAGDADGSKLFTVITKLSGSEAMPPDAPLTNEQIAQIYVWILQGAKDN